MLGLAALILQMGLPCLVGAPEGKGCGPNVSYNDLTLTQAAEVASNDIAKTAPERDFLPQMLFYHPITASTHKFSLRSSREGEHSRLMVTRINLRAVSSIMNIPLSLLSKVIRW